MTWSKAQAARLRRIARGRSEEPLFMLEGAKAIADAIRLGVVDSVFASDDLSDAGWDDVEAAASSEDIVVHYAKRAELERACETKSPQGVVALVHDTSLSWDDLSGRAGFMVWLDELQDPGNVGAIMRVIAAFGVDACVLTEGCAHPLGPKALRASAGLALHVPFARTTRASVLESIDVDERDVWMTEAHGDNVFDVDEIPNSMMLVIGSEARGVDASIRDRATKSIGIPLAPGVESLNAAVAAGVIVSTLTQQRSLVRSKNT